MNGILPPISKLITHKASIAQTSIAVSGPVAYNSTDVTDSVVPIERTDYSIAERPLALNLFHTVRNNDENHQIRLVIKRALISSDCDPSVKVKIFKNIMSIEESIQNERRKRSDEPVDISYLKAINDLLDEIRKSGNRIILDKADFTGVNLKKLNLSNTSAVSTKFNNMKMDQVVWKDTDFENARFCAVEIRDCQFLCATFNLALFTKSAFVGGLLNNVTITKTRFYETNFDRVLVPQIKSDDAQLRREIMSSEICELSAISLDSGATDRSDIEFDVLGCQRKMDSTKNKFAQCLKFNFTSCDSNGSSISILRTSLILRDAIPEFPVHVAELVSQYACEDSFWAKQPLKTDFRSVIDSEENRMIKSAIKKALTSEDFDPKVKRAIFKNMADFNEQLKDVCTSNERLSEKEKLGENSYIQVINELLCEIRGNNGSIRLDNTDFTGINICNLNLSGTSAVASKFESMKMEYVVWRCGNFSRAQFKDVNILQCRFKDSNFNRSIHCRSNFYLTELTAVQMFGVEFQNTKFDGAFVNRLLTDDTRLGKMIAEHRFTLVDLTRTYSDPEFYKKSLSARLIIQYAGEETTDAVNFLAAEFTTKRPEPKIYDRLRNFRFLR